MIDHGINRLESTLISISELNIVDQLAYNAENKISRQSKLGEKATYDCVGQDIPSPLEGIASVLLPLVKQEGQWHILLTLRAKKMRHHGGEVAFPGGMWEQGDDNLVVTALRECEEEVAIPPHQVSVLGGLQPSYTRNLTRVRPIVGIVDSLAMVAANPSEIADIFTVPVEFFIDDSRIRTDIFTDKNSGSTHWVPAYSYQGYEIWGFTASVIVQLINRCFIDENSKTNPSTMNAATKIVRQHAAPEKIWKY